MSLTQSSSFPGPTPSDFRSCKSSLIEDRLIHGMGYCEAWTRTASPGFRIREDCPSIETPEGERLFSPTYENRVRPENYTSSGGFRTRKVIAEDDGNTRGRNDKLRGQIGVRTIALSEGCTIGPPADSEYAVEPVGVEMIRPSQTASVRCCPSTNTSIVFRCGLGPRWSETSFMTCQPTAVSATV